MQQVLSSQLLHRMHRVALRALAVMTAGGGQAGSRRNARTAAARLAEERRDHESAARSLHQDAPESWTRGSSTA